MYMIIKLSLSTYTMIEDDLYRAHILHHFYKIQHVFVMGLITYIRSEFTESNFTYTKNCVLNKRLMVFSLDLNLSLSRLGCFIYHSKAN